MTSGAYPGPPDLLQLPNTPFELVVLVGTARLQTECISTRVVGKERCESGRIGLTANELTWETGSEGSNPSLSAQLRRGPRFWTSPSFTFWL